MLLARCVRKNAPWPQSCWMMKIRTRNPAASTDSGKIIQGDTVRPRYIAAQVARNPPKDVVNCARLRRRIGYLNFETSENMFFKSLITDPTPVLSDPATFDVHGPRRSARSSRRHIGHSWAQHPIRLSKNHWR